MTPLAQQKFNTFAGGLLLGIGVVAWLTSVAFAVIPNDEAPAPVHMAPVVRLESCAAALRQLGYAASVKGEEVVASEPLAEDVARQLEKASIGVLVCKLPLHQFCYGNQSCDQEGLSFTLRRPAELRERIGDVAGGAKKPAQTAAASAK